jgi:uridine phosphorylase
MHCLISILSQKKPKEKHTELSFIRIGTSGSLQESIPVDSFIASAYGVGLDNLLHFYNYKPTLGEAELYDELTDYLTSIQPIPFYTAEGSPTLLSQVGHNMHQGITLTAVGFYGPQGRSLRLQARYDASFFQRLGHFQFGKYHITNMEMETAAIYGLCRLLGHRALSTNAILANRQQGTFSTQPKKAVDQLIKTVLERIV